VYQPAILAILILLT